MVPRGKSQLFSERPENITILIPEAEPYPQPYPHFVRSGDKA
jgi:hypothetical protein